MTVTPEQWEREEILSHEAEETPVHVSKEWPTLHLEAFHGEAGRIINGLAPTTEADPAAMLADLLATFGWLVGVDDQAAHMLISNTLHHARTWPIIVGTTSSGAKGTSHGAIWRIVSKYLSTVLNPPMHKSGLSSGEGLVEAVRDETGDDPEAKNYDPGVLDKRLLVFESEIAQVFRRSNREGSSLGTTLRQSWDGDNLSVMNRKALSATNPHIVVIGHISPGELQAVVRAGDVDGGTMNRFIYICSRRSKRLPDGGNAPQQIVDVSAQVLGEAVEKARSAGRIELSAEAKAHWRNSYLRLTADRPDTVLTKVTGRRAPQVLRLAMIYCLLDMRTVISVQDLRAAEALEQYSVDSARYIFESHVDKGSNEHGRLAEFIRSGGVQGKSRAEISIELYKRNRKSALITADLATLMEQGSVVQVEMQTDGRKKMVFFAREHSHLTKST